MKYFTYQGSNHDCGFASLKMLLANLSNNKDYLHLKKEGRKDNYSFLDLIKIGNEHGLTLKAYKYATSEVNEIKTPFLALIDENHLVLVKENKRGKYLIYDPGKGIYKMKHSEFDQVWTGKTLEVVDYVKQDYHQKANRIMPIKTNLISLGISIVSLAAILVGFFFVKEDAYFFIPIICLAVFSISELVDNWYLIKELNFFDKKYIPLFFEYKEDDIKKQYQDYVKFKSDYFAYGRKFYSACIISALIIVVLVINNPLHSIACLSLICFILFERILFKRKDDDVKQNMSKNEDMLISYDNQNLIEDILLINQNANSFALSVSIRKCINTFVLVILSFTMMMVTHNISVNFILFHFGVFYVYFNNIEAIIMMGESGKEFSLAKARFLDACNL